MPSSACSSTNALGTRGKLGGARGELFGPSWARPSTLSRMSSTSQSSPGGPLPGWIAGLTRQEPRSECWRFTEASGSRGLERQKRLRPREINGRRGRGDGKRQFERRKSLKPWRSFLEDPFSESAAITFSLRLPRAGLALALEPRLLPRLSCGGLRPSLLSFAPASGGPPCRPVRALPCRHRPPRASPHGQSGYTHLPGSRNVWRGLQKAS